MTLLVGDSPDFAAASSCATGFPELLGAPVAGTFTCAHVVTSPVEVVDPDDPESLPVLDGDGHWIKTGEVGSETWQSDEVKFRVRYVDRATYKGVLVDELEDYSVTP